MDHFGALLFGRIRRNCAWRSVSAHRDCNLEAGAVFLAGVDDGRISLCAALAFPDHVGIDRVCVWALGDGGPSWME